MARAGLTEAFLIGHVLGCSNIICAITNISNEGALLVAAYRRVLTPPNDVAWLKGLYKMSPAATLNVQQDEVSYQMQQSLEGK